MKRILATLAAITTLLISAGASAYTITYVGDNYWYPSTGGTGSFYPCGVDICAVKKDFTSLGSIPIIIDSNNQPSTGTDLYHIAEAITNDTGVDWTDFHLRFLPIDNNPDMSITFLDVTNATDEFTSFTTANNELSLFGNVLNGHDFSLEFTLQITSQPGSYNLFAISEQPSVSSVPEPATMTLLGLGLAAVAASRRRRL